MTTLTQTPTAASIEDYLEGEQHTDIKHEYLGGQILAMGGASDRHGLIGLSLAALLHPHARSKAWQLFMGDMKVRVDHDGDSFCLLSRPAAVLQPCRQGARVLPPPPLSAGGSALPHHLAH